MSSLATLVQQARRFVRDWPDLDTLTASISSSTTTITVADSRFYAPDMVLEADAEAMLVSELLGDTTIKARRGMWGTTAASHAAAASLLLQPAFLTSEIADALNAAKDEMYPYVYKPVLDTSLVPDAVTYEFTVPSTIRHLSKVELLVTGDVAYRTVDDWTVLRASTPKLKFRRAPVGGTLRLHGFGPFDDLTALTDTTDALFPTYAERPLILGAASRMLASGEAGRGRGEVSQNESFRASAALNLANQVERRFEKALMRAAMPPLPTHIVSVL